MKLIKTHNKEFQLQNETVLELGTGWHGVDILVFFLLGAVKIYTVDHQKHLNYPTFRFVAREILKEIQVMKKVGSVEFSEERIELLGRALAKSKDLYKLLNSLNIHYLIARSCNTYVLRIPLGNIGFFYTSSTLQRIPERHLRRNLKHIGTNLMQEGAVFYHETDQKDINSMTHIDGDLWGFDYLKYNSFFFNFVLCCRFNSQNRLRESDFLQILKESHMQADYVESVIHKSDFKRLKTVPLSKQFRDKKPEDIIIRQSKIIGRRIGFVGSTETKKLSRKISYK